MDNPSFHKEQPGKAHYYSSMSVYNFGVVDHGHQYPNVTVAEHLYTHVYHEGMGKKGANNVVSLLLKTMRIMDILREDKVGGELSIVFDNCPRQTRTTPS